MRSTLKNVLARTEAIAPRSCLMLLAGLAVGCSGADEKKEELGWACRQGNVPMG